MVKLPWKTSENEDKNDEDNDNDDNSEPLLHFDWSYSVSVYLHQAAKGPGQSLTCIIIIITANFFEHVTHHPKHLPYIVLFNLPEAPLRCRYH